jgi:hypothetical protein
MHKNTHTHKQTHTHKNKNTWTQTHTHKHMHIHIIDHEGRFHNHINYNKKGLLDSTWTVRMKVAGCRMQSEEWWVKDQE